MGFLLTPIDLNQDQTTLIHAAESWAEKMNKVNHLTYVNKVAGSIELSYLPAIIEAPVLEEAKEDILNADKERVNHLISVHGKKHCKGFALAGTPGDIIENLIKSSEYEMVMIGHDYEKYRNTIFTGSNADQIVRVSTRPVAIIRSEKAVEPKNIVGLIDFSHDVPKLIQNIKKLAKAFSSKVTLYNVTPHYLDTVSNALTTNTGLNAMLVETENKAKVYAEKELEKLSTELKSEGIEASFVIEKEREATGLTIKKYLNKNSFDLVVMGAHAPNIIERFFLGSISYELLHQTNNNLLLVK